MPVPTAATNGLNLLVNPKFWRSLTYAQRRGLLTHECLHVVFGHSYRLPDADPEQSNQSFDYVINLLVEEVGPAINAALPKDGLINHRFKGWSEERVSRRTLRDEAAHWRATRWRRWTGPARLRKRTRW